MPSVILFSVAMVIVVALSLGREFATLSQSRPPDNRRNGQLPVNQSDLPIS